MEQVELVAPVALPIKGSAASATPVEEFFANPPEWFSGSLKMYHQNPERNFRVLCMHVAAAVLEDGGRWEEVAEEVRKELDIL